MWLDIRPDWLRLVQEALLQHKDLIRTSFQHSTFGWSPPETKALAGQLNQMSSFALLDTFVGPLAALSSSKRKSEQVQLVAVVERLPKTRHLLLEVSDGLDLSSLLKSSRAWSPSLPQLKRPDMRYMMYDTDKWSFTLLDLAEYFRSQEIEVSVSVNFEYE